MPQKCKDPGTFVIPCSIGDSKFENCMLDLGENINVMTSSMYNYLDLSPLQHTCLIIQLANRSNARPTGVVEDVLVQVNDLIFPADFYILDMYGETNSSRSPIILGRPFLKTAKTKVDVNDRTMSMEFDDIEVMVQNARNMRRGRSASRGASRGVGRNVSGEATPEGVANIPMGREDHSQTGTNSQADTRDVCELAAAVLVQT
ncbi:hypothetical protein KIW84_040583 [Lathyrus oleraceus]|uniref:Uncharacterized protein n=1 Tax=Pisum sativum TaxID=3888 RepID=A0A9D4X939_PEA|nr:hypothetical protein KIW84_040583 [Pisum sativum]